MPKKKKPFIDPKTATKFRVAHRSQFDPLIADEEAPKFVLVPTNEEHAEVSYREDALDRQDELREIQRKEDQIKHGIYYDDDYDYMQHLASTGEDPSAVLIENKKQPEFVIDLPEDVLPSREENEVGMLNLAAPRTGPQLDCDFDVLAQLDDVAEHPDDWQLDDDFFDQANQEGEFDDAEDDDNRGHAKVDQYLNQGLAQGRYEVGTGDRFDNDTLQPREIDSDDDYGRYSDFEDDRFEIEETQSRFTEYSMTSSVMPRTSGLKHVDDHFENFFERYEDAYVGGLNDEYIEGSEDINELMKHMDLKEDVDRMSKRYNGEHLDPEPDIKENIVIKKILEKANEELDEEELEAREYEEKVRTQQWLDFTGPKEKEEKWDCESILSTRTNIYNHPETLRIPRNPKKKATASNDAIPEEKSETAQQDAHDEDESDSDEYNSDDEYEIVENKGRARSKKETPEEKRARKQAVRESKKGRRETKKKTKTAFKKEELLQEKHRKVNNTVRL